MIEKLRLLAVYSWDRLQETSTVRGMLGAVTLLGGWITSPEHLDAVAAVTAGVSAVLKILLPDRWTKQ